MITTQRKLEIVRRAIDTMKIEGNYQERENLVYEYIPGRGPFLLNEYERAYANIVYREYGLITTNVMRLHTRTMEDLEKELMIQLSDEKTK